MKNADQTIERVLAALRHAEPSATMERRILEAMAASEAETSPPFWPRLRPMATSLAVALAIAGMVIVVVAVQQHRRAPADTRSHSTAPVVRKTTQPEIVLQQVAPRHPVRSLRHAGKVSAEPQTQVASFPAPPLPLTEQERLLLRLAHRRDPEDTAILNPAVQAAQSAKATVQFQQFFGINPKEMRSQLE
jgi:hypothetical protein